MKFLWIGGWAIPPAFVRAEASKCFPDVEHHVLPPTHDIRTEREFDRIIGHSLGAFLLLRWPERFRAVRGTVLLAPFLGFPLEFDLGGRVSLAQLRLTARHLRKNPLAAVNDFYERADLSLRATALPYLVEDLAWGLDVLQTETVDEAPIKNQSRLIVLGEQDPLLEAARIAENFPCAKILPMAGHRIEHLLAGFSGE